MNQKLLEVVIGLKDKMSSSLTRMGNRAQAFGARVKAAAFSVKGLVAAIAGLVVIRQAIRWMQSAIEAANVQETAVRELNAALAAQGNFTAEASKQIQDYAAQLQYTVGIADEVIIKTAALIEGITGLSTEAMPDAIKATIQISQLYGVDLKNAAILLGKSLTSTINAFSRYGIQIDTSASQTEKLRQILEKTSAGFDIAVERVKDYEGAVDMLKMAYGDLLEQVGAVITQSPGVIQAVKIITRYVRNETNAIQSNVKAWQTSAGVIALSLVKAGAVVGQFAQGVRMAFNATLIALNRIARGFVWAVKKIAEAVAFIVPAASGIVAGLDNTVASLDKGLQGYVTATYNAVDITNRLRAAWHDADVSQGLLNKGLLTLGNDIKDMTDNLGGLSDALDETGGALNKTSEAADTASEALSNASSIAAEFRDNLEGVNLAAEKVTRKFAALGLGFKEWAFAPPGSGGVTSATASLIEQSGLYSGSEGETAQVVKKPPVSFWVGLRDKLVGSWESILATGIGAAAGGGGVRGVAQGILPIIGTAVGGPIGGAIGGFLGSLFGKRGSSPQTPLYTRDRALEVKLSQLSNILLNITKAGLVTAAAPANQPALAFEAMRYGI